VLDKPPVAIILVNWNNWRDCLENIDSVLAQNYPDFHIFIVDNDSSDQSIEHIRAWCAQPRADDARRPHDGVHYWTDSEVPHPITVRQLESPNSEFGPPPPDCRLTLVRSGGNLGFASGCNIGVRCAGLNRYGFFWFLNTDAVVHRDALAMLVERAASDPRVGMVGSTVRDYDRPDFVQALGGGHWDVASASARHIGAGLRLRDAPSDAGEIEDALSHIFGASMLVSDRFIREIGPMREDYFLYYEEIDWAMRSRKTFRLGYARQSHVFHKAGASSFKVLPLTSARYFFQNQVRFVSRYFPECLGTVKLALLLQVLRYGLRGRWGLARVVVTILRESNRIAADAAATGDCFPSS
jgi:GT2 family glycosyltransferase